MHGLRLRKGEKVNIDAEIKAATERINRQIGQWGRHAHAENAASFAEARADLAKRFPSPEKFDWAHGGILQALLPEMAHILGLFGGVFR